MRLQLDSTQLSSVENRQADAVGANGSARNAYAQSSGAGDTIGLSGVSNALHQFTTDRAARLQQLASAVQNGSYRVSSSAVSSAIVQNGLL